MYTLAMVVEVQNDCTEVEYPDAPGDYGEIFDYVVRKGPVTRGSIVRNTGWMSPDDIYRALKWCEEHGHIKSEGGDLEENGTTERVYYVPVGGNE